MQIILQFCQKLSEFIGFYPKLSVEKHRRYLLNTKEEAECPMASDVIDERRMLRAVSATPALSTRGRAKR